MDDLINNAQNYRSPRAKLFHKAADFPMGQSSMLTIPFPKLFTPSIITRLCLFTSECGYAIIRHVRMKDKSYINTISAS